MGKNQKTIKLGWAIPVTVKDCFIEFCAQFGLVVQEDCAGALFLWQRMPAQIREWAKLEAKNDPRVDKGFWLRLHNLLAGSIPMLQCCSKAMDYLRSKRWT